jgi:uncharacterized protein DUF1706
VNKQGILNELTASRVALNKAIVGLTPEQMHITGVIGLWSIKDTLAHLVAWESEVVTALNQIQHKRIPSLLKIDDIDEWNDEQYHISATRPLQAVLEDFDGVHKMLYQMITDFDEGSLVDNRRYPWMEGEPLWYLIEENVTLHEHEHAEDIISWRESMGFTA